MEAFFCKNKPWTSVIVTKPLTLNGTSHPRYMVSTEIGFVGIYEWGQGEYHCSYAWDKKPTPCSEYDFVRELKKNLTKDKNNNPEDENKEEPEEDDDEDY